MTIRRELDAEESIDDDMAYRELFLAQQYGVALTRRSLTSSDKHVCFRLLSEDDGHWFDYHGAGSAYWIPDMINALVAADKWCQANCVPFVSCGVQYGWNFKE